MQMADLRIELIRDHGRTDGRTSRSKWRWKKRANFTIRSTYRHFVVGSHALSCANMIWKSKCPLKGAIMPYSQKDHPDMTRYKLGCICLHGSRQKIAEVKPLHVFVWYRSKLNITSTMIRWIIYDNLTFQIHFTRILSRSELEVKKY